MNAIMAETPNIPNPLSSRMKLPLFRRTRRAATIAALYGTIVAQARSPSFYRDYGVPDTVNGRFDMIVLHVALVLRRLEGEPGPARVLGQGIFDRFCQDMDDNLREMGVGDLKVPKEMQRMGEAFYGRVAAYRAALGQNDDAALTAALARNLFDGNAPGARRLAAYMRQALGRLSGQDGIAEGRLDWPRPELISLPEKA
jgi:cytochrome b pre-mRNA-processing protein 3